MAMNRKVKAAGSTLGLWGLCLGASVATVAGAPVVATVCLASAPVAFTVTMYQVCKAVVEHEDSRR